MKKPELALLESFVAVVREGTLVSAAAKLNMTQSALSMQLKRLETYFEFPIFEYQGKRKALTPHGSRVFEETKKLLLIYDSAFESLNRSFSKAEGQTLKIGCRRELIPMTAKRIQFSGVVVFFPMSSEEGVKSLLAHKIDLAVGRIRPDSHEILAKKFFTSGSSLVIHKKWLKGQTPKKFASNKTALLETPCLTYGTTAELFQEWTRFMNLNPSEFKIKFRCEDWVSLLQLIEMGEGYSIMPDTLRSSSSDVEHFQIEQNLVPANPHYFLCHKSLLRFPAFAGLFQNI